MGKKRKRIFRPRTRVKKLDFLPFDECSALIIEILRMKIDDELISRLEKLAQLELSPEEREKFRLDLEKMTDLVSKLAEFEPDHLESPSDKAAFLPPWREDVAAPPNQADEVLREAPKRIEDFFQVPRVIASKKKEK